MNEARAGVSAAGGAGSAAGARGGSADGDPAGRMLVRRRAGAGARTRALAGLSLAVGGAAVVAAGLMDTTVSAPGMQ
ncbi:hypothetical protein [Actinosynnema pretiosum]|uniref:Uncharacterized protein n=1 Tax=Actinosynnema pretiosum TaxID=42197 RepID=A0A290ZBI9_9PSEU|nr:hypothetical protein [Actinosynnema pretiosum]ATE56378.1 hypothetical protein CNX65_26460 [Actinosynnema pretiosum]